MMDVPQSILRQTDLLEKVTASENWPLQLTLYDFLLPAVNHHMDSE